MIESSRLAWKGVQEPPRQRLTRCWSLMLVVLCAGCGASDPLGGAPLFPVKGKVVLPDGRPLTTGAVLFVGSTTNISVSAPIGADGVFEFAGDKPGLPAGEYRVAIEAEGRQTTLAKASKSRPKDNLPFPARYLDDDASKLTASVKPDSSSNDFTFTLSK